MTDAQNAQDARELELIREMFSGDDVAAGRFVGHQINVIDSMAGQLNTLAGILLAVTGAVLANLATVPVMAKAFLLVGTSTVLASILVAAFAVFRLRWFTRWSDAVDGAGKRDLARAALQIRSAKARGYHLALGLIVIGLASYALSIFVMLLQ